MAHTTFYQSALWNDLGNWPTFEEKEIKKKKKKWENDDSETKEKLAFPAMLISLIKFSTNISEFTPYTDTAIANRSR